MKVTIERLTSWALALENARGTMGKESTGKEPSSEWKSKMCLCRHSPLESVVFKIRFEGIPSWVSVHLVRHKIGVTHYVSSQRDDRNLERKTPRAELPQGTLVNHTMVINAQEIIQISKKRLCNCASPETREAWGLVRLEMSKIGEVELAGAMNPECFWCGYQCPELKGCGKCPAMKPFPPFVV